MHTKAGRWTSPTLLAPRRSPMSQVCLAPVGPDAWPSEGLLSPEVALRTTVGPPRHGTAPAAGRATSGVVVNGRPRRLVLIQVRAALAHLRLLGGALNLGPVVEVRFEWESIGQGAK